MKLRIELEYDDNYLGLDTYKEVYEKYHKKDDVLFDDEVEQIYYDVETDYMPQEGQRVGTKFGMCIVRWAYFEFHVNDNDYDSISRIVVSQE